MPTRLTRRDFLAATGGAALLATPALAATAKTAITVGIPVDTHPDWNGAQNFIRSIDEAFAAGYRCVFQESH